VNYKLSVPSIAEDVEEFRVLDWHGDVGDRFDPGALVVELETHKAVIEVRAAQPGVLRKIIIAAGAWCQIGRPLALFSDRGDEAFDEDADLAGDLLVEFEST